MKRRPHREIERIASGRRVLTILAVTVLAGCAARTTGSVGAAATSTSSALGNQDSVAGLAPPNLTPLTTAIEYPNTGFDIEPPGTARAVVPWSKAYATCLTGDAICDPTATPTIVLASVSDDQSGKIKADGSLTPLLHNTLVWVITYTNRPCAPAGGAVQRTTNASMIPRASVMTEMSTAPSYLCTVINFISAGTGAVLYSFQGPNP